MTKSQSALLSVITIACAWIFAGIFFIRPAGPPEGEAVSAVHEIRQDDESTILERSEANPPNRVEVVPVEAPDTWLSRLIELQSLPEGSLAEITAKHDAIQAVLNEPRPKKTAVRIKPGVDWRAERRAQNPELACVGDDLFRLRKLIREMRYAEYLSAQDPSSSLR